MTDKLIYFSSTTCSPCKVLFPKMEKFAAKEGIELEKVLIDAPKPGQHVPADLLGVPSIDIYHDGAYLGRLGKESSTVPVVKKFLGL